ncbi:MAG: HAMP domain-containing histidine kinase [Saprospiraceae bacterium]|nr:HAMP domain-containing histidine kinase [Saprospiraceae bacterium]
MGIRKTIGYHHTPMAISLILLAVFLSFYLWSVYQIEKNDLKREVNYLLENAFKTAENQMLDKMIFEMSGASWMHQDSVVKNIRIVNHHASFITSDTVFTKKKMLGVAQASETMVLKTLGQEISGDQSLSLKIEFQSDSFCLDTNMIGPPSAVIVLVDSIFKENLKNSQLSINYEISSDSALFHQKEKPAYRDNFSGKKYFLIQGKNQSYLINQMLPEIVLSILLFLTVLFAFYHIISSHQKEQELFDMKEDFMRNMTHELKTPIATIGVTLEALQNFPAGKDEAVRQEYFRIAESENQKLNALVEKVLSIAQHMDESQSFQQKLNLPMLVSDVMDSFKMRAAQKNVQLNLENAMYSETIQVNQQILVMVLHNLLDNAIKYVKSDAAVVAVLLAEYDSKIQISIRDNGSPIEAEFREKIFDKFYRIPSGDVHDVKGHGLGLYIVGQLVKTLKAEISLNVTPSGNEFVLKLPKT